MAEAFVKTFKRDDVLVNPIPNAAAALALVDIWMEDYNTVHPLARLGYRSPREYILSQPVVCPVERGQLHPRRNPPILPLLKALKGAILAQTTKKFGERQSERGIRHAPRAPHFCLCLHPRWSRADDRDVAAAFRERRRGVEWRGKRSIADHRSYRPADWHRWYGRICDRRGNPRFAA